MSVTILCGDALTELRKLPSESVHCCVTSPPYWGLRDYGTAQWEGGDDSCDHRIDRTNGIYSSTLEGGKATVNHQREPSFGSVCGKCRAVRIDSQLGLDKTPEEYVAKMVEVFREVRRVLRKDGTLWLNLGSSYSGSGKGGNPEGSEWSGFMGNKDRETSAMTASVLRDKQPIQFRVDVPACGIGDIEPQDSRSAGRACSDSCDESQAENPDRSRHSVHNDQCASRDEPQLWPKDHDNAQLDCVSTSPNVSPLVAQASKAPSSLQNVQDASDHVTTASAFRLESNSSSADVLSYADNSCLNYAMFSQYVKPKDMVPIPWMVAMALQKDGWYLRCDCIWAKKNCMPESVTDRPTKAHEYLFLLTKAANYFYDAEAIKERASTVEERPFGIIRDREWGYDSKEAELRGRKPHPKYSGSAGTSWNGHSGNLKSDGTPICEGSRNKRSVWTVATAPYPEAHFATYPPDLIKPCILAGTSAKGCCAKCGSPWERVVERESYCDVERGSVPSSFRALGQPQQASVGCNSKTIGWQPTCKCCVNCDFRINRSNHKEHVCDCGNTVLYNSEPATVIDPFAGSGTTGMVALELGRKAILIELNPKYIELIRQRCNVTPGLALA